MLDQQTLCREFDARVTRALSFAADHRDIPRTGAIAVVRDVVPMTFVRSVLSFAAQIPEPSRSAWYAAFTRTIFLAGDPGNVTERHPCDQISADGSIAWYGPGPLDEYEGLRRLLRPFHGPLGITAPPTEEVRLRSLPGGATAHLDVASGQTAEQYLINVNHLVAEAALDGLFAGVGRLLIRHHTHGPDHPTRYDRIRVSAEPSPSAQLHAHAYLSIGD